MPSGRVVRILGRVAAKRGGYLDKLRTDNVSEFAGSVMAVWAESRGVESESIPGQADLELTYRALQPDLPGRCARPVRLHSLN